MRNPYLQPTKQEMQKKREDEVAIEKKISATVEIAKRLLNSDDGVTYKESMKRLRADLEKHTLVHPGYADPVQDAHFLRSCIIKMGILSELLGEIRRDAKKHV